MITSICITKIAMSGTLAANPMAAEHTAALMALQETAPDGREDYEEYRDAEVPPAYLRPDRREEALSETNTSDRDDDERRDYVRFKFDMVPLSYTYGYGWDDPDREGRNDRESHTVTFLGGPPIQSSGAVRAGLGVASGLGLNLGYVWDDQFAIGNRVGIGWQYNSDDDSDASGHIVTYSITPELDYMFRPGERVQPLVTVRGGLVGSYQQVEGADGSGIDAHTVGPLVGAGIGGLWWVASNVAFDTRVMFDYSPLWATGRTDDVTDIEGYDRLSHNMSVSLVTGIAFGPRSDRERRPRP